MLSSWGSPASGEAYNSLDEIARFMHATSRLSRQVSLMHWQSTGNQPDKLWPAVPGGALVPGHCYVPWIPSPGWWI